MFNIKADKFKEYLKIEEERNELMIALSGTLGIDISFSEEEVQNNAMDAFIRYMNSQVAKGVDEWMKSAFS